MSNYARKADLKNPTGVDTPDFAEKTDLGNLRSDVNKLDNNKLKNLANGLRNSKSKVGVDKLVPFHVDLSKLSWWSIIGSLISKIHRKNYKISEIREKCLNKSESEQHF